VGEGDESSAGPPVVVERVFERRAREAPDATALVRGGDRLTYRELDEASNRLAHRLIREGAGPESLVGIHLDRSFELVAAILAVLKAGAAWVPIDPDYPEDRVRLLLEDSGVELLIARPASAGEVPLSAARRIALDDVRGDFQAESPDPPPERADLSNLAYVIYTSGSTGRPKGTLVTRGNLARLFPAEATLFDFGPSDAWLLLHSPAFDFSIWETWRGSSTARGSRS
jgi:non-ribosomal peptide synthetase component F